MLSAGSIRFRLTVWYSLVLLLGLMLFGGFVWLAMRRELRADVNAALALRMDGLEEYLRLEEAEHADTLPHELSEISRSLPADDVVRIAGPDGARLFGGDAEDRFFAHCAERRRRPICEWRGKHYRVLQERALLRGREFQLGIAAPVDDVERTLARLGFLLVACIPGVVLAAAAGGFWISGRALSPVDAMTVTGRSIGIENLSARLPVPVVDDEIRRLAVTWNDMLGRLETAVARITQFTADASHELRTPIAFIRATAEIALRRPRPEEHYREALRNIEVESERMTELVENLLFLARTDARETAPEMRAVPLERPLRDAIAEVEPAATAKRIQLTIGAGDAAIEVAGSEAVLRRMFVAILENAVKYTAEAGSVCVEMAIDDGSAIVSVRDTGVGISAAALAHVFERFYRADPSRTRESGGYGLGLSIAQTIAMQHGGVVTAESQVGVGSVFQVRLPVRSG